MRDLPFFAEEPSAEKSPTVTYELFRDCDGDQVGSWCVKSIRYTEDHMSHEIKFRERRELADVVGSELFGFFQGYLPVQPRVEVISAKDAQFQLANLFVKHIQMTAFAVKKSVQRCILIVNEYRGNLIKSVSESYFISNILQMRDTLISKVVGDVLLPILNLSNVPEDAAMNPESERRVRTFMQMLRTENGRLTACLEYLLHYVSDSPNNPHAGSAARGKRIH